MAAVGLLLALAGPASAHPTLLTTVPAAGYTGEGPVAQVVLAFDEPVSVTAGAVHVTGVAGDLMPGKALQQSPDRHQLVLPLRAPLPTGQFQVHWQVTAADGDVADGSFAFGVGTSAPTTAGGGVSGTLGGTAVLRWLLFTGLALATGGLLGERLVHARTPAAGQSAPRAPLQSAAALGMLAAVGLTALVAHATGGWSALIHVRAVELTVVETAAFALALVLASVARLRPVTAAPLAVVIVAEGLRAHPNGYAPGWGAALTVVHLAAAAVWVGALVHVVRAAHAGREHDGWGRSLLRGYASVALGLFLLVVVTGTMASLLVLRTPRDLIGTGYGRVLTVKLALVGVVTVLALVGRRRVRLAAAPQGSELRLSTRVERSLLALILAITALLVSLPAPRPTATALTLPPPPIGPTAGFGALLGQLSLGATASTGQLRLQLSAPGSDPTEPGGGGPDAQVTVSLHAVGATPVAIPVRRCGPGCYLTAPTWRAGVNQVTVAATAPRWHGGSETFTVPWPPVDATNELLAMITALRGAPSIVVTEGVSSDTTGRNYIDTLPLTGAAFVDSEPFGNGSAPLVTALPPAPDGGRRLAVAYPVIGVYLTVTLDAWHRPVTEVQATPDHLITRTFTYPTRG